MTNWLLLHGAWHGAWCWTDVKRRLEDRGDRVLSPTLSGLGEKSGLMARDITLDTWIGEVRDVIEGADLTDVVLVGHSFAGTVITGVADRIGARIASLVYLDAALLEDGESMFGTLPPAVVAERRRQAEAATGGLALPAPPPEAFGVTDPALAEVVAANTTAHPISTYEAPLTLARRPGEGFDCTYVVCTDPLYAPLVASRERARAYGWPVREIATGHDLMITAPQETADLIVSAAAR